MIAAAKELGDFAKSKNTLFMLEPLNRYEQHYLRTQADGVRIIKAVGGVDNGVGLLSDFFHMHIEETNSPQAFREAKGFTNHIHLADNTRMEPGTGDIDFVASFKCAKGKRLRWLHGLRMRHQWRRRKVERSELEEVLDYMRACIKQA